MKNEIINGFSKDQIFQLYKYLVAYEESGIGKYKSTKALLGDHPELSGIEQIGKSIIFHSQTSSELTGINFKSLINEVYFTKSKGNLLLSFLAHLRNSIAHGNVVEHKGMVLITDFENPKYHPTNFNARGCIELGIVNMITNIFKQIEL
jgi:hypothetical protein